MYARRFKWSFSESFVIIIHSNGHRNVGIVLTGPKASLNTVITSRAHHACYSSKGAECYLVSLQLLQGKDSPQLFFRKPLLARNKAATPTDEKGPSPLGQYESIPVIFRNNWLPYNTLKGKLFLHWLGSGWNQFLTIQ